MQYNAYTEQSLQTQHYVKGKQVHGARHALRRAGGAGAATTVSAPAALHSVGQRVRAQGNRDEFTGVNRDVLGRVHSLEGGRTAATSPVVVQVIVHGLPLVLFVHGL